MSANKKPFDSYEFGGQMAALGHLWLDKYGPTSKQLLGESCYMSACLSAGDYLCRRVYLSVCPSVCPSVVLAMSLRLSVCLSVR